MIRQIPLTFAELPVSKIFGIAGTTYEFRFRYNERAAFVSMEILDGEETMLYSTRLCYGQNAIHAVLDTGLFPAVRVVPMSEYDYAHDGWSDTLLNAATLDSVMLLYDDLT